MKEIKFRAKDIKSGKWAYGFLCKNRGWLRNQRYYL
jgi:hypothetical protein